MSDEHTHDDCVQCLQKEVRRLKAELDDQKAQYDEADSAYRRAWAALQKLGVISINADTGEPTIAVSPCCKARCEFNADFSRNCTKCGNAVR